MGFRLTLYKIKKSGIEKIRNMNPADEEYEHEILHETRKSKIIVYDFCTDAFLEIYNKLPRLTKNHMDVEEDIILSVAESVDDYDIFFSEVKRWAERMIINISSNDICKKIDQISYNKEKSLLSTTTDWLSAVYQCLYIEKQINWEKESILFRCS